MCGKISANLLLKEHSTITPESTLRTHTQLFIKKTLNLIAEPKERLGHRRFQITTKKGKGRPIERILFTNDSCPPPLIECSGIRDDYKEQIKPIFHGTLKPQEPFTKEQLVDIYSILKITNLKNEEKKQLMNFALKLTELTTKKRESLLGQFMYLLNVDPGSVKENISIDDFEQSLNWIDASFQKKLSKISDALKKHYLAHEKSGLQSPHIAYINKLTVELSHLLIMRNGLINSGIIPILARTFIDRQKAPLNHTFTILHGLTQIATTPTLREKLANIKPPKSPKAPANQVIRSILDIPHSVILTANDARKAALTGLLSHIRQGSEGTCFATPLASWVQLERLASCLDDFASLLRDSKLTRKTKNVTRDYPFLLRMGNQQLNRPLTILRTGEIEKRGFIWDSPGIQKACEAIELDSVKEAVNAVLDQLFLRQKKDTSRIKTTVKTLLKELVQYRSTLSTNEEKGLLASAVFAYEGQVNNALIGVWQNTLSGMAESEDTSIVTSSIINTLQEVFQEKLNELGVKQTASDQKVNRALQNRIHLHYDPIIPHTSLSSDQHSAEGAFVLYDKIGRDNPASWIRIDNPTAFQAFATRVAEDTGLDCLTNYIQSDTFLAKILTHYYSQNSLDPKLLKNYKQIQYAPWVTKCGNNFNQVLQTYFEGKEELSIRNLNPTTPLELILKIVKLKSETPSRYLPARVKNIHAFLLTLDHPTLPACKNEMEKIIIQGLNVSQSTISQQEREKCIAYLKEHILQEQDFESFKALPVKMSYCEFRTKILELLATTNAKTMSCTLNLDTVIYNNLPEKRKQTLNQAAIHFADTNWSENNKDLHFCLTVNPGSGEPEIWLASDDQEIMYPLNQRQWLGNWEFFILGSEQ